MGPKASSHGPAQVPWFPVCAWEDPCSLRNAYTETGAQREPPMGACCIPRIPHVRRAECGRTCCVACWPPWRERFITTEAQVGCGEVTAFLTRGELASAPHHNELKWSRSSFLIESSLEILATNFASRWLLFLLSTETFFLLNPTAYSESTTGGE